MHGIFYFGGTDFNSHPHEEDDVDGTEIYYPSQHISTHILTKRMTEAKAMIEEASDISTHILTKRMTLFPSFQLHPETISTHILTKRMTSR